MSNVSMVFRLALFVLILALTGCARPASTPLAATQTPPAGENPLAGTNWRLVSLRGQPAAQDSPIYLMFGTSTFRGVMGCNNYGAQYLVEGADQIRLEMLEVTVELCPDADLMQREAAYIEGWKANAIGRAMRFAIRANGSSLEFFDAEGRPVFVFENALDPE